MKILCYVLVLMVSIGCTHVKTSDASEKYQPCYYKLSVEKTFKYAKQACKDYFHRDAEVLEHNKKLYVNNNNFWAGDTDVYISLSRSGKQTKVDFESVWSIWNPPLINRSHKDYEGFYSALNNLTYRADADRINELQVLKEKYKEKIITKEEYIKEKKRILTE